MTAATLRRLGLVLALAALGARAAGQAAPTQDAPPQDDAASLLDGLFAPWDHDDSPGLSVAIVAGGEIIYERGFGMADLQRGVRNTPDTVFRIGSTSKQFTATCIAMLALRGDLDLDADVRTLLPELPAWPQTVTVRHMVHHMSGIPDYVGLMVAAGHELSDHVTAADTLDVLSHATELLFTPGERYEYSNSNYFLLGAIVRRVSGQPLRRFAEEHIFEPLGMTHTHYHDRFNEIVPNRADGYEPNPLGPGWVISNTAWEQVGDGGVFTTVRDLAKWDAAFYDHALEGGAALFELLHTRGVLNDGTQITYAFGLGIDVTDGRRVVAHAGGWAGFRAELMRWPDDHVSVIVLANCTTVNPTTLARHMGAALF